MDCRDVNGEIADLKAAIREFAENGCKSTAKEFDLDVFMRSLEIWEKMHERRATFCRVGAGFLRSAVYDSPIYKAGDFDKAVQTYISGKKKLLICGLEVIINDYYGDLYSFHDCLDAQLNGDIPFGGGKSDN